MVQQAPHSSSCVALTLSAVVNQRAFSNSCGLPLGAVVDFDPPELTGITRLNRGGARCGECRAFLSQYCKFKAEDGTWVCCMCNMVNMVRLANPEAPLTAYPELCQDAVEYAPTPTPLPNQQQQGSTPAHLPPVADSTGTPGLAPHVVLVLDANLEPGVLANLRTALPAALQASLHPNTLISVVGCDSVVSLWALGAAAGQASEQPGRVFANTLPGDATMDMNSVGQLAQQVSLYTLPFSQGCSRSDGGPLGAVLGAIRPLHSYLPAKERPRCLAVGIEAGLRMMAASARATLTAAAAAAASTANGAEGNPASALPDPSTFVPQLPYASRLLLITGGPCTVGPCSIPLHVLDHVGPGAPPAREVEAAREHSNSLATMAQALHVPIDVLAVGTPPTCNVALMAQLCESTGGALWHHDAASSALLQQALQASCSRCWGTQAVLDIYLSKQLKLSQWLGPVAPIKDLKFRGKGVFAVSPAACLVGGLCDGQGAAARLELKSDLNNLDAVHVQVVLQYTDVLAQRRMVRVVTRRLQVVQTIAKVLEGLDPVAAAVEVCKRIVSDAVAAGAHRQPVALAAARAACAASTSLLASRFGKAMATGGMLGIGGRRLLQLPAALVYIIQSLQALQRGPLLGEHSQQVLHPEQRLLLMRSLLTSNTATAAAIINPALYALIPNPAMQSPSTGTAATSAQADETSPVTPTTSVALPQGGRAAGSTPGHVQLHGTSLLGIQTPKLKASPFQGMKEDASTPAQGPAAEPSPTSPFLLVPLPSIDILIEAAQQTGLLQPSAAAMPTPGKPVALILDQGTRLTAWWASQPAAGGPDALLAQIQQQLVTPLLSPELPLQLLDRFPLPGMAVIQGHAKDASTALKQGLLAVQVDTAQQQLTQLLEPLYCSGYWQYMRAAGSLREEGNIPDAKATLPHLFTAASELAGAATAERDVSIAGKKAVGGGDLSLVQWCSSLGVLLPTSLT